MRRKGLTRGAMGIWRSPQKLFIAIRFAKMAFRRPVVNIVDPFEYREREMEFPGVRFDLFRLSDGIPSAKKPYQ